MYFSLPTQRVQARRHREAVFGQRDRRREQRRPRQPAMLAMRGLQEAHDAGHADRPAADHRVVEVERLAVPEEAIGARGGRRRLAAVVGDRAACRVASCTSRKAPPPMPDDCGSTRPSTSCTAMAASDGGAAACEDVVPGARWPADWPSRPSTARRARAPCRSTRRDVRGRASARTIVPGARARPPTRRQRAAARDGESA